MYAILTGSMSPHQSSFKLPTSCESKSCWSFTTWISLCCPHMLNVFECTWCDWILACITFDLMLTNVMSIKKTSFKWRRLPVCPITRVLTLADNVENSTKNPCTVVQHQISWQGVINLSKQDLTSKQQVFYHQFCSWVLSKHVTHPGAVFAQVESHDQTGNCCHWFPVVKMMNVIDCVWERDFSVFSLDLYVSVVTSKS